MYPPVGDHFEQNLPSWNNHKTRMKIRVSYIATMYSPVLSIVSLTILVRAMSLAACVAVLRQLRRENSCSLSTVAALTMMISLFYFLFREAAAFVDVPPLHQVGTWTDSENMANLSTAIAVLVTIIIIHQLLVQRHAAEEQVRIRDAEIAEVSRATLAGQLLSGIAHELAQPLSAISNYSAALRNTLRRDPAKKLVSIRESNERISEEASRATSILQGMRGLVIKSDSGSSIIDLHDVIRETIHLARVSGKLDEIKIETVLVAEDSTVNANPVEITQVIMNLLFNACESFGDTSQERLVSLTTKLDRPKIMFSVTDNGRGLPLEVSERMYEPFFSTKPNGMGMGLWICRMILARYDGELSHVSGMPRGASLSVSLPLANASS